MIPDSIRICFKTKQFDGFSMSTILIRHQYTRILIRHKYTRTSLAATLYMQQAPSMCFFHVFLFEINTARRKTRTNLNFRDSADHGIILAALTPTKNTINQHAEYFRQAFLRESWREATRIFFAGDNSLTQYKGGHCFSHKLRALASNWLLTACHKRETPRGSSLW